MSATDGAASPHVLRDYAMVADGERGALIGPEGDIAWMCAPGWDDGSVFGALVGASGVYTVRPPDRFVWGGAYEAGSLIWRNRWTTTDRIIECREALTFPGAGDRLVLLRRVLAPPQGARVHVVLDPRADYGASPLAELHRDDDGVWHGRVGSLTLRFRGGAEAEVVDTDDGRRLEMTLSVPGGRHHDLVLELGTTELGSPVPPDVLWRETEAAWERVAPRTQSWASRDATQAACVLRGLTGASGGMVAAATTSLPERFDTGQNYDYRYVWIRDQCYAGHAAAAAGLDDLFERTIGFLTARLLDDGPDLAPAYTHRGGTVAAQRQLDVPGYPGGGNTVGNQAAGQFQLDAFGELLLLLGSAARQDRLDAEGWRAVETAVGVIEKHWTDRGAGIWELEDREWTHSRLICVAGLRAVAAAQMRHAHATHRTGAWSALADRILADTAARATHPSGRWQRAADDPRHDGALLLPALRGAVPPDDPRSLITLRTYLDDLTADGYAYRYRHDDRPLGEAEGAFLLCGFFVALACRQQGDERTAVRFFDRGRSACGPPGLFSEEFDVIQRQLRGNLPQAFVHALLLESAVSLAE